MESSHDGKILEVDFKKKKLVFTFGYKTDVQKTLELEQDLEKSLKKIYDITADSDFKFNCRSVFQKILQRCIDGK